MFRLTRRLACASLLAACQSVYSPFTGGGDGGPITGTTVVGGMNTPDLAYRPDGSIGGGPTGNIHVRSGNPSQLSAVFENSACIPTLAAGCTLRACASADMAVPPYTVNIGAITVVAPISTQMLLPVSDGLYVPLTVPGPLWSAPGAMVTVSASGADFPSFSLVLDGPTAITITDPQATALDVPRDADFSLSWADGTSGRVTVQLANTTQLLECDFAVAAGSAIVPRQALGLLEVGAATLTVLDTSSATVDGVVGVRTEVSAQAVGGGTFAVSVNLK